MQLLLGTHTALLDPGQLARGNHCDIGHVRFHQRKHTGGGACNGSLSMPGPIEVWDQTRYGARNRWRLWCVAWSSTCRGNPGQPVFSQSPRVLGTPCLLWHPGFCRRAAPARCKNSQGWMELAKSLSLEALACQRLRVWHKSISYPPQLINSRSIPKILTLIFAS